MIAGMKRPRYGRDSGPDWGEQGYIRHDTLYDCSEAVDA